jgi:hypothetical protein
MTLYDVTNVSDIVFSVCIGFFVWYFAVRPFYPWNWKGDRKVIKLKKGRKDWD